MHTCTVCSAEFELRYAYQVLRAADAVFYFCSQACHNRHLLAANQRTCSVCADEFQLTHAFQQNVVDGETVHYCAMECRNRALRVVSERHSRMRRIAVLNQKGGTGKTTTSVSVAAGLAEAGKRVLLIDLDAQGNVGVSLGLSATRTIRDILVDGAHPADCVVQLAENFSVIVSDTSLADAEMWLVNARDRERVLSKRMASLTNYDYVILDCGPSISMLNQNALTYADNVLIPVSCDYLSLVGVRQILRTLRKVNEKLLQPVSILGVVPTFYDVRTRISADAIQTLNSFFKDSVLPPVRVNTRLKEAPSHKQTIFEYAPDSHGAADYRAVVERIIELVDTGSGQDDESSRAEMPVPLLRNGA